MKKEDLSFIKDLAFYSTLGFTVSFSIFIGLAIGVVLDQYIFQSSPWLTLIFLGIGIAAAFKVIAQAIKKIKNS